MKRQLNSLFFMAALLLFVGALTSCGSKEGGSETETATDLPPTGGITVYGIRIVKVLPDSAAIEPIIDCATATNCWSEDNTNGSLMRVVYCSTNDTQSPATITFDINGAKVTGQAPVGTAPVIGQTSDFGLTSSASTVSYSVGGGNLTPVAKCR